MPFSQFTRVGTKIAPLVASGLFFGAVSSAWSDSDSNHPVQGLVIAGAAQVGINSDDEAVDFNEHYVYYMAELGYRFKTGTHVFANGGLAIGGHESLLKTYGLGVRQLFILGPVAPFAEVAVASVGDEADTPLALSLAVGVEAPLSSRLAVGLAAGHYVSKDSDERGALDWHARAYLAWNLGNR